MKDTLKHKGLRQQLVNVLFKKGISDELVLNAIKNIPFGVGSFVHTRTAVNKNPVITAVV